MSDQIQFIENKPLHHYRTELPNCILKAKLDPYCLAVYCHVKQIAGDNGACWMSTKNLADQCGICRDKLIKCLDSLCKVNEVLQCPLLRKIKRKNTDGGDTTSIYEIIDVWNLNSKFYGRGGVSATTTGGVCHNDTNKNQENNERSSVTRAKVDEKNVPNVQNERKTKERAYQRPYKNRPIPHFIRELTTVSDQDKQTLANQFTEQQLALALEDALSYHRKKDRIKNTAAFLTKMAKFYRDIRR